MSDAAHETPDNPGVIAHPPLIYVGTLAVGLLVNLLFPVTFLPRPFNWVFGLLLVGGGLILGFLGDRALDRAETNRSPYRPTTRLATAGSYRFTRNPLYLSVTLLYVGIAVLANALWAVLLLPLVLVVMQFGVIKREERYLERKFGEEYLRYKARVRRWI